MVSRHILGLYRDNGKENGNYYLGFRVYSPTFKWKEYGVYGDLNMIYPELYSIYLRGNIWFGSWGLELP